MVGEQRSPKIQILLVEDNPDDAFLALEAIDSGTRNSHVSVVQDGVAALAFLRQEENYSDAPHPHLVLLDINLPKKKGLDVLREMKNDRFLRNIPVIMMTSSTDPKDILEALNHQAYRYIPKPIAVDVLLSIIRSIILEQQSLEQGGAAEELESWARECARFG
jgi:CheY-like chemotaxis protein